MNPTRKEKVNFRLDVDAEKAKRFKEEIECVLGYRMPTGGSGDTIKVDYTIWIEYFGDTEKRLRAIERLINEPDFVVTASVEEIQYGRSIILDVATSLDRVMNLIEAKKS